MIEVKEVRRQDYKKAQKFAIQGMHLDWYMELNRVTKAYGAYFAKRIILMEKLSSLPLIQTLKSKALEQYYYLHLKKMKKEDPRKNPTKIPVKIPSQG